MALKPDEVANARKIDDGWQTVRKEYGKKGYIDARLVPDPSFDDASAHVRYHVSVSEGQLFRMGTFQAVGLPAELAGLLSQKWRLKAGDVFDASYIEEFTKKDAASVIQSTIKPGTKLSFTNTPNREQHTVDVIFRVQ